MFRVKFRIILELGLEEYYVLALGIMFRTWVTF